MLFGFGYEFPVEFCQVRSEAFAEFNEWPKFALQINIFFRAQRLEMGLNVPSQGAWRRGATQPTTMHREARANGCLRANSQLDQLVAHHQLRAQFLTFFALEVDLGNGVLAQTPDVGQPSCVTAVCLVSSDGQELARLPRFENANRIPSLQQLSHEVCANTRLHGDQAQSRNWKLD
jgi:hypothetical protein